MTHQKFAKNQELIELFEGFARDAQPKLEEKSKAAGIHAEILVTHKCRVQNAPWVECGTIQYTEVGISQGYRCLVSLACLQLSACLACLKQTIMNVSMGFSTRAAFAETPCVGSNLKRACSKIGSHTVLRCVGY
jgi:hypothetical protein